MLVTFSARRPINAASTVLNAVQLQENALKFYMGMPIATLIEIPQAEFEVAPQAFAGDKNRVFVNEKQEQLLEFRNNL
jgi:hypothetical protein